MFWFSQLWPAEAFWKAIWAAEDMAARSAPDSDPSIIRELILREWLAMSVPAGRG